MPRPKGHRFTVRGKYNFPFDMLRYDQAFPADGHAVSALDHITSPMTSVEERIKTPVEVELITHSPHITPDRWASFGWVVVKDEPYTPY